MKKKYLIIFLALVLVFVLVSFLVFKIGKRNNADNNAESIDKSVLTPTTLNQASTTDQTSTSANQDSTTANQDSTTADKASTTPSSNIAGDEKPVDIEAVNKKIAAYRPEIAGEKLGSFSEIAAKGDMSACESLAAGEADNCKYYFSVYKNEDGFCGDIETESLKSDCYKKLISENLADKIEICRQTSDVAVKGDCLKSVFWGNETTDSCAMFTDSAVRQICADAVNLKNILADNENNCLKIKDSSLKTLCDQHFIPGDFDKDGLPDADEDRIGTNPYSDDTDGDGYKDKSEIDQGYNPCGAGAMPSAEKLLEACAALKK